MQRLVEHFRENGNWQKAAYSLVAVLTAVLGFLAVDIHTRQARADVLSNTILQRLYGIEATQTMQQAQTNQLYLLVQQVRQNIMDHMNVEKRRP